MRYSGAGCITAFISGFSRIMVFMFWISRPVAWNAAFETAIWPCLGFLFLPFTTLMYVWLIQGAGTIEGIDWLWLILAVILDVAQLGYAGYANRTSIPGYTSDTVTPGPSTPTGTP